MTHEISLMHYASLTPLRQGAFLFLSPDLRALLSEGHLTISKSSYNMVISPKTVITRSIRFLKLSFKKQRRGDPGEFSHLAKNIKHLPFEPLKWFKRNISAGSPRPPTGELGMTARDEEALR